MAPPQQFVCAGDLAGYVELLSELLRQRDQLKALIAALCGQAAGDSCRAAVANDPLAYSSASNVGSGVGGCEACRLDASGLERFRSLLSRCIPGVPDAALHGLLADAARYDFAGDGCLGAQEVLRLVRVHFMKHLRELGGFGTSVPLLTLSEAGYTVLQSLGHGSHAVVQLCLDANECERVAKCYPKERLTSEGLEDLQEDLEALSQFQCPLIACPWEIFQDNDFVYMVHEAFRGGDFAMLNERAREGSMAMSEDWWRLIFWQCLLALEFMHQQAVLHCDIKETNLMLKTANMQNPEVVVVDIGVATSLSDVDGAIAGTPGYQPPETVETKRWYAGGDVFSLGVVVFQVFTDKVPWASAPSLSRSPSRVSEARRGLFLEGTRTLADIYHATMTREPPFNLMSQRCSDEFVDFTRHMLRKPLRGRPRPSRALHHPWLLAATSSAAHAAGAAAGYAASCDLTPLAPAVAPACFGSSLAMSHLPAPRSLPVALEPVREAAMEESPQPRPRPPVRSMEQSVR
eukprot:TRINITY_DN6439_c0_g1_i2.p1 TRINITY_DN6439_c0_g1~~TRINITY_DN6439_c0_g1_i2.p1  ORF type:complete len:518 (-),score=85.80 TRINITY_DN6439_c0_g1_i2:192-1745(-)